MNIRIWEKLKIVFFILRKKILQKIGQTLRKIVFMAENKNGSSAFKKEKKREKESYHFLLSCL